VVEALRLSVEDGKPRKGQIARVVDLEAECCASLIGQEADGRRLASASQFLDSPDRLADTRRVGGLNNLRWAREAEPGTFDLDDGFNRTEINIQKREPGNPIWQINR
jgi:hypothetical protein